MRPLIGTLLLTTLLRMGALLMETRPLRLTLLLCGLHGCLHRQLPLLLLLDLLRFQQS